MESNLGKYRLRGPLKSLDDLPKEAANLIREMINGPDSDIVDKATGVLLLALISHGLSVAILSLENLEKLITINAEALGFKPFSLSDRRGPRTEPNKLKTIYACLTGRLVSLNAIDILIPQDKNKPGVIEVIDSEWLCWIGTTVSDAEKLKLIEQLTGNQYQTLSEYLDKYNRERDVMFIKF